MLPVNICRFLHSPMIVGKFILAISNDNCLVVTLLLRHLLLCNNEQELLLSALLCDSYVRSRGNTLAAGQARAHAPSHRSPVESICSDTLVILCHRKRKYISLDTVCFVYSLGLHLCLVIIH